MYIVTSTYGCAIVVKPNTAQDIEKFLSVRGAMEISEAVFKENTCNLTNVALSYEDAMRINDFVGDCKCWQFKNRKMVSL